MTEKQIKTPQAPSRAERFGMFFDDIRHWVIRSFRIGKFMTKGAYLLGERRTHFLKLGEQVYYRILKGEMHDPELIEMVAKIDRFTRKIEIEETLIRSQRFGTDPRPRRNAQTSASQEGTA